jgi:hypothetical protein
VIHGGSTQSIARVMASDTGVTRGDPTAVSKASAVPTARQPELTQRQAQVPHRPRHHKPKPKSHRPSRPHKAKHNSTQANANLLPPNVAFMLLDHAVLDMRSAGASPKLLAFLNQPQDLVSTPRGRSKPLINASRIQVFSSYTSIVHAIANHHIAADTRAVVYDNERSTGTPAAELKDPVLYCQKTAKLLHDNGLEYIASPGFDLSGRRPSNGQWFQQFVRAGLMDCARYADYLDIQDQLMEGTTTYAQDAHLAATLLHQINPQAKLLMGLSTSPSGRLATAGQLWQAYQDTSRFVSGYWLNVPHNVSGRSRPAAAVQFLQKLEG